MENIDEWNRLRKRKDAANRIEVIELKTDSRDGQFLRHEPARARVLLVIISSYGREVRM